MDNHNTSLFTKTMSFVVVSLGIFLRVYAFCINPTQGLYTPLPVDMTDTIRISTEEPQKDAEYVPGEIIVKFKPTQVNLKTFAGQRSVQNFAAEQDLLPTDSIASANLALLSIEDSTTIEQKIMELESDPNVEYAEPNYIYHPLATVHDYNDIYAAQMSGLTKIEWPDAMDILNTYTSLTDTLVAIIDVGVAYDHPDLVNQMRDGSDCKSYTGVTIAGGCAHGYDFYDNDTDPYPRRFSTHGTHIAGTIAAQINNATGIMGVNPHTKIMAIRIGDDDYLAWVIIEAIQFAMHNNAKIINASFGGTGYSIGMHDAIRDFGLSGGLFVAAAGNNGRNNETPTHHTYPSDYDLPNILSVAATTESDGLASFSNYGSTSVDVGAPGTSIYSTTLSTQNIFTDYFSSSFTGKRTATGTNPSRGIINGELYGDAAARAPYTANSDTTITLISGIDLSHVSDAKISWYTKCDTELSDPSANSDYMALEYSSDGTTFTELGKRNELTLRNINGFGDNYITYTAILPSLYLTNTFSLKFRRHSDNDDNTYDGCLIDNISIVYPSVTGQNSVAYEYKNGTSMATPHVVGLASMLRSANSGLSYAQVKNIIMQSGDSLSSLSGKTVSGRRINAEAALLALGVPNNSSALEDSYTAIGIALSGAGIQNNLSSVRDATASHFTGLYFAKRVGNTEMGRITFTTGIDLTDTGTQAFISGSIASAFDAREGHLGFVAGSGFEGKSALVSMVVSVAYSGVLSTLTPDHFAVRSSTGELLSNDIITAVSTGSCSQSYCPVYLTIDHFTDFDLRPILTYVHIQSNNTFSPLFAQDGDEVTLDFVSNEALTTSPLIFINGAEFVATDIQNKTHWQKVLRIGNDISLDDGQIFFALAYADELLNTGLTVTGTTDDSFVIVANSPEAPSTPTIETIGTITSGDSIDLVGVASPYTIISVFFDEKRELIIATGSCDSDGRFSLSVALQEGDHTIQVYSTNISNESSEDSNSILIKRDTILPVFTGLTTVGIAIVSGGYYNTGIAFTFADANLSGALLNGASYTQDSIIWDEGTYTFMVIDTIGHTTQITFTIDTTSPTLTGAEQDALYNHTILITGSDTVGFSGFLVNGNFSLGNSLSLVSDGSYTITGYDRAGNTTRLVVAIDQVMPVFTGLTNEGMTIVSGEYYNTGVIIVFATGDIASATLDGQPYTSGSLITGEGLHRFVLSDIFTNTTGITFTIDTIAPTSTGLTPTSGTVVSTTNTVVFTRSGYDTTALSGYTLFITGSTISTIATTGTIYTGTLGNGTYTRYVQARDRAGNSTMSAPATFTVEAPLLPVLTLTTGNLYYNSTRYTKDYATLTIYTNKLATYSITGDFVTSPLTGSLNGIFTGNLTLTGNDGTKTLSVYVSDGFVSTGKQFSVMLDTTAPTLPTLSTPLSGSILTGTFTLDWSDSTDTGVGMSGYRYVVSTNSTGTTGVILSGFTASSSQSITNGLLSNGLYYRYIQSIDALGNTATSTRQPFTYSGVLDMIPSSFEFEDITDADINQLYLSDPLTITGLSEGARVLASISKGVLYISGEMVGTTGYVQSGWKVAVELVSSDEYDTSVYSTLTIGGISDKFSVTTQEEDEDDDYNNLSKTQKLQVIAIFETLIDLYDGDKAGEFLESLLVMLESKMDDYDDDEEEYYALEYLYDLVEEYYEDEFDPDDNNTTDLDDVSWIVNGVYTAPNGKKYTITYNSTKKQFTSTNFITPKYFPTLDVLKYTIDMSNPKGSSYANAKNIKARWGKISLDGTWQTSPYTAPNRKVFYFFKTVSGRYSSYTFSVEKYFDTLEEVKQHIYYNNK